MIVSKPDTCAAAGREPRVDFSRNVAFSEKTFPQTSQLSFASALATLHSQAYAPFLLGRKFEPRCDVTPPGRAKKGRYWRASLDKRNGRTSCCTAMDRTSWAPARAQSSVAAVECPLFPTTTRTCKPQVEATQPALFSLLDRACLCARDDVPVFHAPQVEQQK
jgi:hypothetical protein